MQSKPSACWDRVTVAHRGCAGSDVNTFWEMIVLAEILQQGSMNDGVWCSLLLCIEQQHPAAHGAAGVGRFGDTDRISRSIWNTVFASCRSGGKDAQVVRRGLFAHFYLLSTSTDFLLKVSFEWLKKKGKKEGKCHHSANVKKKCFCFKMSEKQSLVMLKLCSKGTIYCCFRSCQILLLDFSISRVCPQPWWREEHEPKWPCWERKEPVMHLTPRPNFFLVLLVLQLIAHHQRAKDSWPGWQRPRSTTGVASSSSEFCYLIHALCQHLSCVSNRWWQVTWSWSNSLYIPASFALL